jgi:hypothetical protein
MLPEFFQENHLQHKRDFFLNIFFKNYQVEHASDASQAPSNSISFSCATSRMCFPISPSMVIVCLSGVIKWTLTLKF